MLKQIDLNCDVGEISREIDDSMLPFVTSCNVCCGAHAGDQKLIEGTLHQAIRLGVAIGAHPSWPDRENFGRQSMDLPLDMLRTSLLEQILFVKGISDALGGNLQHVKPHGALYHDVLQDDRVALMFVDVVASVDSGLRIYGQADSTFERACSDRNIKFVHEAFGDRRYESPIRLRSRKHDDALILEESEFKKHLARLLNGEVTDIHGERHPITVDTICLHSDTPNAINLARLAHETISSHNL